MSSPPPRAAAVVSALVLAAVCSFAVVVVRRGGGSYVPPTGRCEVSSTRALTSGAGDRVVGLARHQGDLWAVAIHRAGDRSVGQLIRSASGRTAPIIVATAPLNAAAVGPVISGASVGFVSADGPAVRVTMFDGRSARSTDLPRGEQPPGRAEQTPRIGADTESDGTISVAAHWGGTFGTRRLHQRDIRESPGLGPRRGDRFDAPSLALFGDAVIVVQERRVGAFRDDSVVGHSVEAVAFAAAPFDPSEPGSVVLSTSPTALDPRVAATDGAAVAAWRDGERLLASGLTVNATRLVATGSPVALTEHVVAPYDLAATATCVLAVWGRGGSIVARGLRVDGATLSPGAETTVAPGLALTDLRVARVADGYVVVAASPTDLRAWRVSTDHTCAPTFGALARLLPGGGPAGLRLIAVSGDATGATVLSTRDPATAASTLVTRVEIDARFAVGPAVNETVAQAVTIGARQDARIALVGGPFRGTVRVQRLGDAGDDDEPGEDILLRLAQGERIALLASVARHRIWVADRSGERTNGFHPPHSVVLHSVIDTLEDGPRTEVATAPSPEASFASVGLHRLDPTDAGRPAWALVTSPDPTSTPALEGGWVFLFDAADHPVHRRASDGSPWPNAASLLPASLRSAHDRVAAVAWRGTTLAAIVTGPRAGVRLVTGDPFTETLRHTALVSTAPTMVRGATVRPARNGWIAFWLDVTHASPTLHDRRFDPLGVPTGEPDRLGEFLRLDERALDVALAATETSGDEFAVAVPTPHGVRVAEVRCSP